MMEGFFAWLRANVPTLSDIGSYASIVSLFLTVFVAYKIRLVTRHFRQLGLLPKQKRQLSTCLKNLTEHWKNKNSSEFRQKCGVVVAITTGLQGHLTGNSKRTALAVHQTATQIVSSGGAEVPGELAEALLAQLSELTTHIDALLDQKQWT